MEILTGKSYENIISELEGQIYRNPAKSLLDEGDPYLGWEDVSEYLSGNVREKLEQAEEARKRMNDIKRMSRALREVQPAPFDGKSDRCNTR